MGSVKEQQDWSPGVRQSSPGLVKCPTVTSRVLQLGVSVSSLVTSFWGCFEGFIELIQAPRSRGKRIALWVGVASLCYLVRGLPLYALMTCRLSYNCDVGVIPIF